jgi:predicted nucleic acid-binding protein
MTKKLRIYLDVCTYCRPFDDQSAMRVRFETDAYYLIVSGFQDGIYIPIISPAHYAEIEAIKDLQERMDIFSLLNAMKTKISYNKVEIRKRAEELHSMKFGVGDAAHIAFAEASADIFITCDDKLLKRCERQNVAISVYNPVEFAMKEDLK